MCLLHEAFGVCLAYSVLQGRSHSMFVGVRCMLSTINTLPLLPLLLLLLVATTSSSTADTYNNLVCTELQRLMVVPQSTSSHSHCKQYNFMRCCVLLLLIAATCCCLSLQDLSTLNQYLL
jgi:hypothetical protein